MKHLQELVLNFCDNNKLTTPAEYRILDLISEVGEVAKEILKETSYGKKTFENRSDTTKIQEELGDTLFALIALANSCNIDLHDSLIHVLKKYETRMKNGSPGSENDPEN